MQFNMVRKWWNKCLKAVSLYQGVMAASYETENIIMMKYSMWLVITGCLWMIEWLVGFMFMEDRSTWKFNGQVYWCFQSYHEFKRDIENERQGCQKLCPCSKLWRNFLEIQWLFQLEVWDDANKCSSFPALSKKK